MKSESQPTAFLGAFRRLAVVLLMPACAVTAYGQLFVTISPSKVLGQKAFVPLSIRNAFPEKVESARAVMFLIDAEGKVTGQATHWIVGGDRNHPPLASGATNTFHFVVPTGGKPFVANRLTVTHLKLSEGRSANPVTDVQVRTASP